MNTKLNTPRTDAAILLYEAVPAEFARRLERELTELRAAHSRDAADWRDRMASSANATSRAKKGAAAKDAVIAGLRLEIDTLKAFAELCVLPALRYTVNPRAYMRRKGEKYCIINRQKWDKWAQERMRIALEGLAKFEIRNE